MQLTNAEYQRLKDIACNICKTDFANDLLHEALEATLQYPKEKLEFIKQDGKLFFFVARIMANMYHSKTSTYYYQIARFYDKHTLQDCTKMSKFIFTNDTEQQENIELMIVMYIYCHLIPQNRYTLQSLADKTGISRRSIFTTINNVKTYIKSRIYETKRTV
mgnify:CR=1 FL=1